MPRVPAGIDNFAQEISHAQARSSRGRGGDLVTVAGQRTAPHPDDTSKVVASPEHFGAAVGRALAGVGQAISNEGERFYAIAEQQRQLAAQAEAREQDAAYAQSIRDRLYGRAATAGPDDTGGLDVPDQAQPGILLLKGGDAAKAGPEYVQLLEKDRRDFAARIKDPLVRRQFEQTSQTRLNSAMERMGAHVANQRQTAVVAASESRQGSFVQDAIAAASVGDFDEHQTSIDLALDEKAASADLRGLDADSAFAEMQALETTIRVSTIDAMLAAGNTGGAVAYFEQHKGGILPSEYAKVERAIRREQNRQEVELRDEVQDAAAVLLFGKTPRGLADLRARVQGTKLAEPLEQAMQNQQAMADFTSLPIAQQQAELQALNAQKEMDRQEKDQFAAKAKAHGAAVKMIEDGDGIALAAQVGHIEALSAVEYGDPATLRQRRQQADRASARLGRRVPPLTGKEIEHLEKRLDEAEPKHAAALLDNVSTELGQDYAMDVAANLASGKRPEFAVALLRQNDSPQVAADIIGGGRLRREHGQNLQITATDKRDAINEVYGGMFESGDAGPIAEFIAAADALYASRRIPTGNFTFDGDEYQRALRDAAGGVVEFNGRNTIPPRPTFDGDDMQDIMSQLAPEDLIARSVGGGAPVTASGQEFGLDLFGASGLFRSGRGGQLIPTGPGVYNVAIPGLGLVMDDKTGQPYLLDLNGLTPRTGPRAPVRRPGSDRTR